MKYSNFSTQRILDAGLLAWRKKRCDSPRRWEAREIKMKKPRYTSGSDCHIAVHIKLAHYNTILSSASSLTDQKARMHLLPGRNVAYSSPYNLPWRHVQGVDAYLYPFFNLCAKCGWLVNTMLRPLYPRETDEAPIVHVRSGWVWKISPSPGFHPWTVQPIVSRDICFSVPLYLWNFPKFVQECKEIAEQFEVQ